MTIHLCTQFIWICTYVCQVLIFCTLHACRIVQLRTFQIILLVFLSKYLVLLRRRGRKNWGNSFVSHSIFCRNKNYLCNCLFVMISAHMDIDEDIHATTDKHSNRVGKSVKSTYLGITEQRSVFLLQLTVVTCSYYADVTCSRIIWIIVMNSLPALSNIFTNRYAIICFHRSQSSFILNKFFITLIHLLIFSSGKLARIRLFKIQSFVFRAHNFTLVQLIRLSGNRFDRKVNKLYCSLIYWHNLVSEIYAKKYASQ